MTITFGNTRTATLALLDEYDTDGNIQTTADITVKIRDFTNKAMMELASSTAKIPGEKYIVQAPVYNEVSRDTSSIKTFKPGDADISTSLLYARSCFFEIVGPATVVIEETADGSTYVTLETISVASSVTTFTEYRRLITPSLSTNTVRLRFTGSYVFYVRNHILYPYTWPTEADVQSHKPYMEYSMPSDFLELQNVMVKRDTRQFTPFTDYILRTDGANKKIAINRYISPAEFIANYWRFPTLFTYTGVEATDDAQVYGIDSANSTYRVADDAALIIPHYNAAHILLSEGASGIKPGRELIGIYGAKKLELKSTTHTYSTGILNIYGW